MENKNCIFHIPYYVDPNWPSGSNIRPLRIIEAFEKNGYNVDIVMGYAEERKLSIDKIKNKINKGIKYDFLYSESSTEPTLLTEKNHIPKNPTLDFSFIKFCKAKGVPISLFYRDVYWRFEVYDKQVSLIKRTAAKLFYRYDLSQYKKLLDVFYLPSKSMMDYIPGEYKFKIEDLPPAIDHVDEGIAKYDGEIINIFYVGGVGELYNIEEIFKIANKKEYINLVVCCRKNEWESNKGIYEKYINDRIEIIHKSGKELEPYFKKADVFSLFFEPIEYRKFAMPVKLFEYLSYKKPIISTKNTATGEFVEENSIGWCASYGTDELDNIFDNIYNDKEEYYKIVSNIEKIVNNHTWEARAKKVINDLTNKS